MKIQKNENSVDIVRSKGISISNIFENIENKVPNDVIYCAKKIFEDKIKKIVRNKNRDNICFLCLCISYVQNHPKNYDPYKLASLCNIPYKNINSALSSNMELYLEYRKKLTNINPINILTSRLKEFEVIENEDLIEFAISIMESDPKNPFLLNTSVINIAAIILYCYCDINNLNKLINIQDISRVFTISEQTIINGKDKLLEIYNK